jgi:hypothetical protein
MADPPNRPATENAYAAVKRALTNLLPLVQAAKITWVMTRNVQAYSFLEWGVWDWELLQYHLEQAGTMPDHYEKVS